MPQSRGIYLIVASLILVAVGFIFQFIEVWPILSTQLATLLPAALVHLGALLSVAAVFTKAWRKQTVLPAEVLLLSALMLVTWAADLRLIDKFATH
jgi:hypothetical protein